MSKTFKWVAAIIGGLAVLLVLTILIAPLVINLEKYKPQIESKVSALTGRPFKLAGEIKPSLFPWIGVSLSDLQLGNPKTFDEPSFVAVNEFDVRAKLLPLLTGNFKIKRFVVDGAHITLIKNKNGRLNTDGLGKTSEAAKTSEKQPSPPSAGDQAKGGLPIKSLEVSEFAVLNSSVTWIDHSSGARKEVKDINLVLENISLDKPVGVDFSTLIDGKSLSIAGTLGPLGDQPGKTPLEMDLLVTFVEKLAISLDGRIDPGGSTPRFDVSMAVKPFDARNLLADLKIELPMESADPNTLTKIALNLKAAGSPNSVALSNGKLLLDDTTLTFSGEARDFSKPVLSLSAALDQIDLDRYLPPPGEQAEKTPPSEEAKKPKPAKTDYTPLRSLVLDARISVNALKVKNARLRDIAITAKAKDGIIRVDPLQVSLYEGNLSAATTLDVRRDQPETTLKIDLKGVQAEPLIKDLLDKQLIAGAMAASANLNISGDQPDMIRKSLDGKGELKFKDGAIVGIDLADMVRNVQTAFGLGEKPDEKPRTDFSELVVPFSSTGGVVKINEAALSSPLLRVIADGTANLVKEKLDIRVEPKFVATLVGQGDTKKRSGFMVPVLVSGTFSKPSFQPDLKGLVGQDLPGKENLTQEIEQKKEKITEDLQKKAQDLLKGLPFGTGKQKSDEQ